MAGLLIPIILAASAAAAEPTPALGNLSGLFKGDDYPLIALRKDEQGIVKVRLGVDTDGMVSSCTVVESSGSQALDEQTCSVLRARAQFVAAKDAKGRPIESDYTQSIRWNISGEALQQLFYPRQPWMIRTTFGTSKEGKLAACETEIVGFAMKDNECEQLLAHGKNKGFATPGAVPVTFTTLEMHFIPVAPDMAPTPPSAPEGNDAGRQVRRITIDADGAVITCEQAEAAQGTWMGADPCDILRARKFAADPGAATLTATLFVTRHPKRPTP